LTLLYVCRLLPAKNFLPITKITLIQKRKFSLTPSLSQDLRYLLTLKKKLITAKLRLFSRKPFQNHDKAREIGLEMWMTPTSTWSMAWSIQTTTTRPSNEWFLTSKTSTVAVKVKVVLNPIRCTNRATKKSIKI